MFGYLSFFFLSICSFKLDFLSEAEMMKRFDHKNIIRLRGVCTQGEPLYAVMDFMLYGKLYLTLPLPHSMSSP